jgi:hypothetical protein
MSVVLYRAVSLLTSGVFWRRLTKMSTVNQPYITVCHLAGAASTWIPTRFCRVFWQLKSISSLFSHYRHSNCSSLVSSTFSLFGTGNTTKLFWFNICFRSHFCCAQTTMRLVGRGIVQAFPAGRWHGQLLAPDNP